MLVKNWIISRKDTRVELCGMYPNKRNFWVHATLANGSVWFDNPQMAIIWDNPRNVSIPQYAKKEVYKMLFWNARYPRITRLYREFSMSLWIDLEKSKENGRAVYSYSVETPSFEVWTWNEDRKEYDIEEHTPVRFDGSDFAPAPSSLDDAEMILDDLLEWITLRIGDTDREYFSGYTPDQLLWANSQTCMEAQLECNS